MAKDLIMDRQKQNKKQTRPLTCLFVILVFHLAAGAAAGQTIPVQNNNSKNLSPGNSPPSPGGRQTQSTVPKAYDDAIGTMVVIDSAVPVNQKNIDSGVAKILTGYYAPLVFQAAEQGEEAGIQKAASNVLNARLGSVNETYRGMHQWFSDDCIQNLFPNLGQLLGKWMTEFMDGWIADAAQFLSGALRVFVLNPNIAVNGLNGQQDDGISKYVRQGADMMYSIAVDLLLLLFILCIWKFWADASWHGRTSLMSAVGRLIFTGGLLIAWPSLYAFDIQITNEMIRAIYFNSADQVQMLDYAMAQAVKGGLLAAGNGVISVLVPVMGKLALAYPGKYIGQVFSLGSTLIYMILGSMLVTELIYMLILKAVQTALLTAQYLFGPVFLVAFATPDTEGYATGYVKAFIETSLWTFIWVGLLKVMTIILFSDFNPWGKILVSVAVLQLMIQVPAFLGRAQISPLSDFVTPRLVFNAINKSLTGLGSGITSALDESIAWYATGRFEGRGLNQTARALMNNLSTQTTNPELLNSLNQATLNSQPGPPSAGTIYGDTDCNQDKLQNYTDTKTWSQSCRNDWAGEDLQSLSSGSKPEEQTQIAPTSAWWAQQLTNIDTQPQAHSDSTDSSQLTPRHYEWEKSTAQDFDAGNLQHLEARDLLARLTEANGVSLRLEQQDSSIVGSTAHGVQHIHLAAGATEAELAHGIYAASFANNIAIDDSARDAARSAAIEAEHQRPQGLLENLCANWLLAGGSAWSSTSIAKERFQQSMFAEAVSGSQAYIAGESGNAYTNYLRQRYGTWGPEQDAEAVHSISNPDSSESPWNRNTGPSTAWLKASGIPINKDTRAAMQNQTIQSMHPARRKQAVLSALAYTYPQAKAMYGQEHPAVFKLAHGEMARRLPAGEVNQALAMYQVTGQEDICTPLARQFMSAISQTASDRRCDFAAAYRSLLQQAPETARRLGYLDGNLKPESIRSFSELAEHIPEQHTGKETAGIMNLILHEAGSTLRSKDMQR